MTTTRLLAGILLLFLTSPAWAQGEKVSIRGKPLSIEPANEAGKKSGVLGSFLLEGEKDRDTEYDKAFVRVTKTTKIFIQAGKELKPATFDDLKAGQKMEIQFVGPVAESFPVQATAGKIVILSR